MADRYRFTWAPVDGASGYDLIEDGTTIIEGVAVAEIDVLFAGVEPGTHTYKVRAFNATSEIYSPELEIVHSPLSGTVENFRYSIV